MRMQADNYCVSNNLRTWWVFWNAFKWQLKFGEKSFESVPAVLLETLLRVKTKIEKPKQILSYIKGYYKWHTLMFTSKAFVFFFFFLCYSRYHPFSFHFSLNLLRKLCIHKLCLLLSSIVQLTVLYSKFHEANIAKNIIKWKWMI